MERVMIEAIQFGPDAAPSSSAGGQLRERIGMLCHAIRLAAAAYALWVLVTLALYWSDALAVQRSMGRFAGAELSGIQVWQLAAGFAVHFVIWAFTAAACYAVWQLFSGYLAGRIFTLDAALWLRRIGVFGLISQIGDMVTRPLIVMIASAHLPPGSRMAGFFTNPSDLLNILFLTGFIALAHVFRAATEIAEEHAQIV
jgi:Protein of unknown function (DUF2975)